MQVNTNLFIETRSVLGIDVQSMANLMNLGNNGSETINKWEENPALASSMRHKQLGGLISLVERAKETAPFKCNKNTSFTFIDLFAGIGGMRLGFQGNGGKCVFTSEWDKFAQKTYLANYGELAHGDIKLIPSQDIADHDILLAGFPCQPFSHAGLSKGFHDTRGTLFFDVQRILVEKRPKAFLLENVKKLKGHDEGKTLKTIVGFLQGDIVNKLPLDIELSDSAKKTLDIPLNYDVHIKVISSKDFGLPQHRERVFIVGFDKDQVSESDRATFKFPDVSGVHTSVGQILMKQNQAKLDVLTLSERLWKGHLSRREKHAANGNGFGCNVFSPEDKYTVTMSARYYKDGAEILIDQSDIGRNPRMLSPREAAYLQGFPYKFIINAVSSSQFYKQCGNAVSVNVIDAIAKEMLSVLGKKSEFKWWHNNS